MILTNSQGEPIVHTRNMALESVRRMILHVLFINNQFYKL